MQFKMQAIKITRKTYSIAVACLAPEFALEPVKNALGHYLVINQPKIQWREGQNGEAVQAGLGITNKLYPKEAFHVTFGGNEVAGEFFNVEFVPRPTRVVNSKPTHTRYGPPAHRYNYGGNFAR